MVGEPDIIREGCIGVKVSSLTTAQIMDIKAQLTLTPSVYKGEPEPIALWDITDGYLWVPRQFPDTCACYFPEVPLPDSDSVVSLVGQNWDLSHLVATELREERGQRKAYHKMVQYLQEHRAGVLQAYTGCGKTILGFTIAAHFKKAIGVFVYNSHMLDNWIETAKLVFGIDEDQIGIVQGDRCDLGKPITIMMIQSLYSRDYPDELYQQMGFLLADEVNRFAAPVWQSVISMFPAEFRLGMSADPTRKDGLDPVIAWNFGEVGYKVPEKIKKARPLVIQVQYAKSYTRRKYIQTYGARRGEADAMKYRKLLVEDKGRNKTIIAELVKAGKAGRKILVFTQFRAHVEELNQLFSKAYSKELKDVVGSSYTTSTLMGGIKKKDLREAMSGDFIFTTYSFSRDALNLPHIDTIFFATPCGDPLQAIGRLRDTGPEKKSLLAVDFYELNEYSEDRAQARRKKFSDLGLKVQFAKRAKTR